MEKPNLQWVEWHLIESVLCNMEHGRDAKAGFKPSGIDKLNKVRQKITTILCKRTFGYDIPKTKGEKI